MGKQINRLKQAGLARAVGADQPVQLRCWREFDLVKAPQVVHPQPVYFHAELRPLGSEAERHHHMTDLVTFSALQ